MKHRKLKGLRSEANMVVMLVNKASVAGLAYSQMEGVLWQAMEEVRSLLCAGNLIELQNHQDW